MFTYATLLQMNADNSMLSPITIRNVVNISAFEPYCTTVEDTHYHYIAEVISWVIFRKKYITNISVLSESLITAVKLSDCIAASKRPIKIIFEDSENGKKFWKSIDFGLFAPLNVVAEPIAKYSPTASYGTEAYIDAVEKLSDDALYILLPDFASPHSSKLFNEEKSTLYKIKQACMKRTNVFCSFNYCCFESIFIDFAAVHLDWYKSLRRDIDKGTVDYVFAIHTLLNLFREQAKSTQYLDTVTSAIAHYSVRTVEQLCSRLLQDITNPTYTYLSKSYTGNCWRFDCTNMYRDYCPNCVIKNDAKTTNEKFNFVFRHAYVYYLLKEYLC